MSNSRRLFIGGCTWRRMVVLGLAIGILAPSAHAQPALFWLQEEPEVSQFGSTTNPAVNVQVGGSIPLHLWMTRGATSYGYDGISLDVRLISLDGGQGEALLTFDLPPGRWTDVTGGVARVDSGGLGVNDANAFDLTNTDTLSEAHTRLATISFTGISPGTVMMFLCVGNMRITDGGANVQLNFGFAPGSTSPENLLISGGAFGACSNVPEAVISVAPAIPGDFDGDGAVDMSDFGRFQACLTGPFAPQTDPDCAPARLDGDDDVDQADMLLFLNCLSGANLPADPACADG